MKLKLDTHKIMLVLAEKGLTRTALAEISGISRQSISTIMTRGTCTPRTANKLAKGLGAAVNEITKEN